jgi:hypothetical protein
MLDPFSKLARRERMEKYGNYEKRASTAQITWRDWKDGENTTTGVGFAHATRGLCNYISQRSISISSFAISPVQLVMKFRDMLTVDDAMAAYTFGQNLMRQHQSPEGFGRNSQAYAMIMEFMRELPEMEAHKHFGDLADLFMAWFLSKNDPLRASEVLMDKLASTKESSRQVLERFGGQLGGPMQDTVTAHLIDYLFANPNHSVAELRSRYPYSTDVQSWLDNVEAALK